MMNFLEAEEIPRDTMQGLGLVESGDGILQFTTSLRGILDDLKILQN